MAIPDLQKLRDPTGKVAIRPEKSDGTIGTALDYDLGSAEWQISGDRVLTTSDVDSSGGLLEEGDNISLTTNASTGGTVISTDSLLSVDGLDISTAPTTSESETVYFAGFDQSDDTTVVPKLTGYNDSSLTSNVLRYYSEFNTTVYGDPNLDFSNSGRQTYSFLVDPLLGSSSFYSNTPTLESSYTDTSFYVSIGTGIKAEGSGGPAFGTNLGHLHNTKVVSKYSTFVGNSIKLGPDTGLGYSASSGVSVFGQANEDFAADNEVRLVLAAGKPNFDSSSVERYNAVVVDSNKNYHTNYIPKDATTALTLGGDNIASSKNVLLNVENLDKGNDAVQVERNTLFNAVLGDVSKLTLNNSTVLSGRLDAFNSGGSSTDDVLLQNSVLIGDNSFDVQNTGNISRDGWVFINDNLVVDNNSVVKLTEQNTADTSGDLQIRDDSSGDLFSLDDGSSPQLAAQYEGNGAFTFGKRSGTVGDYSGIFGGNFVANEASGTGAFATGDEVVASGNFSFATGDRTDATGNASYAEGRETLASNSRSHAEGFQTVASGENAHSEGESTTASGGASHAEGISTTASGGRGPHAEGSGTTASGGASHAEGAGSIASEIAAHAEGSATEARAEASHASGSATLAYVDSETVVGTYNEDYTGGNVVSPISDFESDERLFSVGVGDNPNAVSGDNNYFDGRGRVDGLYVTYRNGTHVRHGLSVDGYNASLGQYETNFEINPSGQLVGDIEVTGDVEVTEPGSGTILTSPDGTRFRVHVENDGTIVSTELP